MAHPFIETLWKAHQECPGCPSQKQVGCFLETILSTLFPEIAQNKILKKDALETTFQDLRQELKTLILGLYKYETPFVNKSVNTFFDQLSDVRKSLLEDAQSVYEGDPAAKNIKEVIRTYPGFRAVAAYRIAHTLYNLGIESIPRMMTESAKANSGIDINPGATIGRRFFIDHGTAVVIGETCHIGNDVKLYQCVTLGALSVDKKDANKKRHPTIEDGVIIYSGATILGGQTVIGKHSIIGGNVWLTKSVPPNSKIYYNNANAQKEIFAHETFNFLNMKLIDHIGQTPLVELTHIPRKKGVKIFGKLEGQNPGGSVKDRAAYGMITGALARGDIKKGSRLVEATSGNTGIALAMMAQLMGIDMTLVMPESATEERKIAMRAYGAKLILTPADKTIEYARSLAQKMVDQDGYVMLNQFGNQDNPNMHYQTTGPEIWKDTKGTITHFVSAMGTTGTIMGVSRYLKEQNPDITIVGTQPTEGSKIPGIRRWSPEYLPAIFDASRVDKIIDVSQDQAREMAREMAAKEAILSGMSSGGALEAALQTAEEIDQGVIVFIVCDIGERYLSSGLFD